MEYKKPQIALLADALRAVRGQSKATASVDNPDINPLKTVPAYEADE